MNRRLDRSPRHPEELADAVAMADAARLLGVSPRTIQRFIAAGHLQPFYLPGSGRPRIPLDQILAIRRQCTRPKRNTGRSLRRRTKR